jgi:nucleoside-diphosphate-sugar epimerase
MEKTQHPLADDLDFTLAHTRELWEELRGQKIFITGGTGFFGCWLMESFAWANEKLDLGASALVLTRDPAAFQKKAPQLAANPAIQLHIGDVRSFDFPAGKFLHVIHAATEASAKLNVENPALMFDTIMAGTQHTLEFSRACGAKKFLLTSSGAIYGSQPPDITHLEENYADKIDPAILTSAYGKGKHAAEILCTAFGKQHGIETKIARGFAFVGPHLPMDTHFAIGNFINDAIHGRTIHINGDGTPCRSYLYASDLAIWLWTILFRAPACRAYNVGSAKDLTIAELAAKVESAVGTRCGVKILQLPKPGQAPSRYVPSVQRAEEELGLRERVDLETAIKKTVNWLRRS